MSGIAPAIEVRGLEKAYRGRFRRPPRRALAGLDLTVGGGGRVHGFLGPNGSGKTTTLRVLVGLVHADGGVARLLGHDVGTDLPAVIAAVGSLVEAPQFFRNFSGRRNLRYLGDAVGVPPARVDEMLELVDLHDRADDNVRGYSLGMKQRLAIAAAMLKAPRLLLLDEPSNGLDPAGIRDVRALVRRLADEGTTVLLSSHLLAEVQQVCDEVTIVARGRTVASGPVADVLTAAGSAGGRLRVGVAAGELTRATQALTRAGMSPGTDAGRLVVTGVTDPARVTKVLADQGVYLTELVADRPDLEDAFLRLTEDQHVVPAEVGP